MNVPHDERQHLRSAVQRQPADFIAWVMLADAELGAGDVAFAGRALDQARALDPATPELPAFAERLGNARR